MRLSSQRVWWAWAAMSLLAVSLVTVGGVRTPVSAHAAQVKPAPRYADWNVELNQHGSDPLVLDLSFDSASLSARVTNRIYLPSAYAETGSQWPVLYYLHGTVHPTLDSLDIEGVTRNEALLSAIGPGGAGKQVDLFEFDQTRDAADFIVVAPDSTYDDAVCESCSWINGKYDLLPNIPPVTAQTLQADTFLHEELYPLVESLFNARTDRGGRAVMGFSMGGVAAYVQGMLHPDRYALAASISGALDLVDEPALGALWEIIGFHRDQGYGTSLTNQIEWRGFNPKDIATNLSDIDLEIFSSSGDGCVPLSSLTAPDCRRLPLLTNPVAGGGEVLIANQYVMHADFLASIGVKETRVQTPGVHGGNNARVYRQSVVPLANETFGRPVKQPGSFSYRSIAREFEVWGYKIRSRAPGIGFLDLERARTDGRTFSLSGVGDVTLVTPRAFEAGTTYAVTLSDPGGGQRLTKVTASDSGRIRVGLDLGTTDEAGTYDVVIRAAG